MTLPHSGSLASYTARPIPRWEWVSPPEIDRALDRLEADRVAVPVVLDAGKSLTSGRGSPGSRLAAPVVAARLDTAIRASLYLVTPSTSPPLTGS